MIINLLATWIPALGFAFLGVLKLLGNSRVAEEMSKLGIGRYLRLLGVIEIALAALFVVPATMKLGFILASCYFAGAIATELSHDVLKVNPFVPICCKTPVGRSGSVKREPKPHGAVPRATLRGRDHHLVCSVVFALLAQLPRPGRNDDGTRPVGGPRHHMALGPALCAHFESAASS